MNCLLDLDNTSTMAWASTPYFDGLTLYARTNRWITVKLDLILRYISKNCVAIYNYDTRILSEKKDILVLYVLSNIG